MDHPSFPFAKDLVLIGGGHAHALVMLKWAMSPLPGARLTVINPAPTAPYSGMLPGFVAGHYGLDDLNIDLVRLARRAGARLVMGSACGIDTINKRIQVIGQPDIAYDIASVDVGITSTMPDLPGFVDHGVPAKPLDHFAARWDAFTQTDGPARIAVIGAGVAGAELALAMAHRMASQGRMTDVTLLDRSKAFTALCPPTAARLRRACAELGVTILEDAHLQEITAEGLLLQDGRLLKADFINGAAGARPHDWLATTGLTDAAGFIPVDRFLRSRDPAVFAVGDCAEMVDTPRPKAGVYAVRQAPILYENLCTAVSGADKLRAYKPQDDYLKLISLGGKSALAERFGRPLSGPLMWRWKDHIDRSFMNRFAQPEPQAPPALPHPHAAGLAEALGPKPMCGGCGAKIGAPGLQRAMGGSPLGDDAAVLSMGNARQVISTDHLRAMVSDPVVLTRIAATHAMGDVWAMGATPQAALTTVILPRQAPDLAERWLAEITTAARDTMEGFGAKIVGGHSTLGAEMTVGFTVTGLCKTDPIALAGAQPADALILTKPLGSGVIMAAEMQGAARGQHVAQAIQTMLLAQDEAAMRLTMAGTRAMTDVTGFGLMGHLRNICAASAVGAVVTLDDVPLMPGAADLSEAGHRSSLYPENRAGFDHIPQTPRSDLLFDPQTSGGLLAVVPSEHADGIVSKLKQAGHDAARIGTITDERDHILMV